MRFLIFNGFIKAIKNLVVLDQKILCIENKLNYIEKRLDKLENRVDNIYDLLLQMINKK